MSYRRELVDAAPDPRPRGARADPGRRRELIKFALSALPEMQLSNGLLCNEVRRGDPTPHGCSLRYTMMACLGLLRAADAGYGHPLDVEAIAQTALSHLGADSIPGDLGLAIWLDARLGGRHFALLASQLRHGLEGRGGYMHREGMELAWIASGAVEAIGCGAPGAERLLEEAVGQMLANRASCGLLRHRGLGLRQRFPNFTTQSYSLHALTNAARLRDDTALLEAARSLGDAMVRLQLADGGWPWIYDAVRGKVVEPYEVYAVHQDGMAPMGLLALHELTGQERYLAAVIRGLRWMAGGNVLGRDLWDREAGMVYRSIRRRRPWNRAFLYGNTAGAIAGAPAVPAAPAMLEVNETDRPYHLGWILEAWTGREDLMAAAARADG